MPANVPFLKTSFALLSHEERSELVSLYANHTDHDKKKPAAAKELSSHRLSFSALLVHYNKKLAATNPANFAISTEEQQDELRGDLLFTFYLLYSQYQLDELEGEKQNLAALQEKITHCSNLIQKLHNAPSLAKPQTPEKMLERAADESNKAMRLLGLTIVAKWLVDRMYEMYNANGKTIILKEWMTAVNGKRLYWVWGGGLLSSVLDLLSDDFFGKIEAQQRLGIPSPYTGNMSWMLYYARGGIHLFMLLKHTIRNPWMNAAEKDIPWTERFMTQWSPRKFAILNDFIWATANMVCFFWLKGAGMAGYYGNVLTAALLLMDVTLTAIRFYQEYTKHYEELTAYDRDMKALQVQINEVSQQLDFPLEPLEESVRLGLKKQLNYLQAEKDKIAKLKTNCEFNWKFAKYGLINDLLYAVALLLAFAVNCSFFLLPTAVLPATALALAALGAFLCFALTTATTGVGGWLEVKKTQQTQEQIRAEGKAALIKLSTETDKNMQKQFYLTIQSAINSTKYHDEMINYQRKQLRRAVLIDTFLPVVVFASLFLPATQSLGVLAVGLIVGEESNRIIENSAPKDAAFSEFDDDAFDKFKRTVEKEVLTDAKLTAFSTKLFGETKQSSFFTWPFKKPEVRTPDNDIQLTQFT